MAVNKREKLTVAFVTGRSFSGEPLLYCVESISRHRSAEYRKTSFLLIVWRAYAFVVTVIHVRARPPANDPLSGYKSS